MKELALYGAIGFGVGVLITVVGLVLDMTRGRRRREAVAERSTDGALAQIAKFLTGLLGPMIKKFVNKPGAGQGFRALGVIVMLLSVLVIVIGVIGGAISGGGSG